MKFKLIKEPTEELFNLLKLFCLKSKPFDFCELPSMHSRILKIMEYIYHIFNHYDCFIALKNDEIVSFYCIEKRDDTASIIVAVGMYPKLTFSEICEIFTNFRAFYKKENPQIKSFIGEVVRNHKKESYLKFLKKYTNPSRIDLDKTPIMIYFDD